jgi:hypothetical protein
LTFPVFCKPWNTTTPDRQLAVVAVVCFMQPLSPVTKSDRSKSLQQLGWQDWGEATYDSRLVKECHRLRRVPLSKFEAEDLRIMIGQNLGLEYLGPLALEQLQEDPLAEGAYFPGDLLVSLLGARGEFWQAHLDVGEQAAAIAARAISLFPSVPEIASQTVTKAVTRAYEGFQRRQASLTKLTCSRRS